MASSSIEQLRQPAVPHAWQPVRRDGCSSVIPPSQVPCMASLPAALRPPSRSDDPRRRAPTLPSGGMQSNVIVFIGSIKYIYQRGDPPDRGVPRGGDLRRLPPGGRRAPAHPARGERAHPRPRGLPRREALLARRGRGLPPPPPPRAPPPRRTTPAGRPS